MCWPLGKALLLGCDNMHLIFYISGFSQQSGIGSGFSVRHKVGTGRLQQRDLARLPFLSGSEVCEKQSRPEGVEGLESLGRKAAEAGSCVWVAGSHQGGRDE